MEGSFYRKEEKEMEKVEEGEEEEEEESEEEEKVLGTRRQLLNMALTLLGYNEIWLKSDNTIGLSMPRVIHYKEAYWCFYVHIKYYIP